MQYRQTFAGVLASVPHPHDPCNVFNDFVALLLNSLSTVGGPEPLPIAQLLGHYPGDVLPIFPKLIGALGEERDWRRKCGLNPDILGEYYVSNFGVRLMPWDECQAFAAQTTFPEGDGVMAADHACGSGRLLLALSERFGVHWRYCGVETSPFLARMAAVTLFCNGIWEGEVVHADLGHGPIRFGGGWKLSADGVFPIFRPEDSKVWELHAVQIRIPKSEGTQLRFW